MQKGWSVSWLLLKSEVWGVCTSGGWFRLGLGCARDWPCAGRDESRNSGQKPSWWNWVPQLRTSSLCHLWSQVSKDRAESFTHWGVQGPLKVCFDALNESKHFTDCIYNSAKLILSQKWSRKEAVLVLAHFLVSEVAVISSAFFLPFGEPSNAYSLIDFMCRKIWYISGFKVCFLLLLNDRLLSAIAFSSTSPTDLLTGAVTAAASIVSLFISQSWTQKSVLSSCRLWIVHRRN